MESSRDIETQSAHPTTQAELCDKILSLVAEYPDACSRAARRMTASHAGLERLSIAFGAIGYEYSKQLFPWITDLQWFMMESFAAQTVRLNARSAREAGQVLLSVFTEFLAETMDGDDERQDDPFAFLCEIDSARLSALLAGKSASHIALIAVYWAPAEMSRILRVLPEATRIQTILRIARLQRLPETQLREASRQFAEELKAAEPRPTVASATSSVPVATQAAPRAATPAPSIPIVQPAPPRRAAAAIPPPPPVPRLRPRASSALDSGTADLEEALLSCVRSESPEMYAELAGGDYFRAIRGNS